MPRNLRFWSNVALIATAHSAIIVGLIRWSRESKDANGQSVVWLNGGAGDGVVLGKQNPPTAKSPAPRKESKSEPVRLREAEQDRPYLASAPSEIQLSTPKPSPTLTPTPARTPKLKPKETPAASPDRTPKPTPKPTPKASPKKMTLVKASPKPTPEKTENEQSDTEAEKKEIAKAVPAKNDSTEKELKKSEIGRASCRKTR